MTCKCLDCEREFYAEEPRPEIEGNDLSGDRMVDDEDELRAAEEEVIQQAKDERDHRYKFNR